MCAPSKVPVRLHETMSDAEDVTRTDEKRDAYRSLVAKSDEQNPLERPRCRRVDNIKRILERQNGVLFGLIWLRILSIGGLLWLL
jgi:hypothetical protein